MSYKNLIERTDTERLATFMDEEAAAATDERQSWFEATAQALREAEAEIDEWKRQAASQAADAGGLEQESERLRAVLEAAKLLAVLNRTRVWEDKGMNACGMKGGDSSDVHALRKLEAAIAAVEAQEQE